MVTMFNSFHALPHYNLLLTHVIDHLLSGGHELKVQFIPIQENQVADLISRQKFDEACQMFPLLTVELFQPSQVLLGAAPK